MNQDLKLTVPDDVGKARLDTWLANEHSEQSRSQWKQLINAGHVRMDGEALKPNTTLLGGELLLIDVPETLSDELQAEDISLDVLFEDDHMLAINKVPGMVVHPAPGHQTGTLVHALLHRYPEIKGMDELRPGIVHRLDRDTSGVLLVGKTQEAVDGLKKQFEDRHPEKHYLAVVMGKPKPYGDIESYLGRHPRHRQKMRSHASEGKLAISHYKVLEQYEDCALVDVEIETGRTHQIRVHMNSIGHPVVGDPLYGGKMNAVKTPSPRMLLHAQSIAFDHPVSGERMNLSTPVATDLADYLEKLEKYNPVENTQCFGSRFQNPPHLQESETQQNQGNDSCEK